MNKRFLVVLAAVLIIMLSYTVSAQTRIYYGEDFNSQSEYYTKNGVLIPNPSVTVDIGNPKGSFITELDVKALNKEGKKNIVLFKDSLKRELEVVSFSQSGYIISDSGQNIMPYVTGQEYHIAVISDMDKREYRLYINGVLYYSSHINKKYFSFDRINYLRFSCQSESDLEIDNIYVYDGEEFLNKEELSQGSMSSDSVISDVDLSEYNGMIIMFDDSQKAWINDNKCSISSLNQKEMPFEEEGVHYIPFSALAQQLDLKVDINGNSLEFSGKVSGNITYGSKIAFVGENVKTLRYSPYMRDAAFYISDSDVYTLTGLYAKTKKFTTVIGEEKKVNSICDSDEELDLLYREIVFSMPSRKILSEKISKIHPRVMADVNTIDNIKRYLDEGDENMTSWFKDVKNVADAGLRQDEAKFVRSDGLRMDESDDIAKLRELAFVYRITGKKEYRDKAISQLMTVCSFDTWNAENHFLCTSGIMQTVAFTYDWLYDEFSEQQKQIIKKAVRDKGLKPALTQYTSGAFWVRAEHNWNAVCNCGVAELAIVFADDPELNDLCMELLEESMKSIRYMMGSFRPDGAWMEGVGYWYYMVRSLAQYMWTLETSFGTTFGIADAPGISVTGYFPAYMVGPKGQFNISEGSAYTYVDAPELGWFANYLNNNGLREQRYSNMKKYGFQGTIIDMLAYKKQSDVAEDSLSCDKYFRGLEATVMQTSMEDPNEVYVGFAGGSNGYNHAHMDVGSFVVDANGVRWAIMLPGDDYNLPGYFAQGEGGQTWDYYRMRAEGHNTLVINPDSSGGQRVSKDVSSPVIRFDSKPKGSITVVDMTRNYDKMSGNQTGKNIIRGIKLDKENGNVTVQDEIELTAKSEIYWFMHTEADISIAEDGKTAVLQKDGKQCLVKLNSPKNGKFTEMKAEPLSTSPNPSGQATNDDYRKLAIHIDKAASVIISVEICPFELDNTEIMKPVLCKNWGFADGEIEKDRASGIYADGEIIDGFDPSYTSFDYYMKRDEKGKCIIPKFVCPEAKEIILPDKYPGTVQFIMNDNSKYYVFVSDKIIQTTESVTVPNSAEQIKPVSVSGTDYQEGNVPENIVDNDIDTRWSAEGHKSVTFDFGKEVRLDYAKFAFYKGYERNAIFSIETSVDGEQWVKVFEGKSIEKTDTLQAVKLISTSARYLRYNGEGTTAGKWNSVNEAEFYCDGGDKFD